VTRQLLHYHVKRAESRLNKSKQDLDKRSGMVVSIIDNEREEESMNSASNLSPLTEEDTVSQSQSTATMKTTTSSSSAGSQSQASGGEKFIKRRRTAKQASQVHLQKKFERDEYYNRFKAAFKEGTEILFKI